AHFPLIPIAITIGLFLTGLKSYLCRFAFLASAFYILLYYLSWRAVNSLNLKDPVGVIASFLLLIAEFYGVASLLLLWLQVGTPKKSNGQTKKIENDLNLILNLNMANILSDQIKYEPTVDIYIPIYNEPIQILEATLIGATFMDYEKKSIFVCDDGHRYEVEKLAQSFGATYLKGPKKQAKSGNINNALKNSKSEFCVVFDTDHIPTKEFLKETIKYFRDDKLGFIQTPHVFYNQDIFQRSYSWFKNLGNEQDLFNQEIQDRRNQWGGTFFVGSGAVFRRKALEEINGFKLGTVTEDIHTSQELHSRGWTSRFVAKNLAVGLSTDTLRAYLVQRTRWMQGCLQIFFKDNPILKQGLTTRQRLGYFASLWYFFFPLARVIYWLSPLYFLLAHGHPLLCDFSALLSYLLPFMLLRPMITGILMPDWKRGIMGAIYEAAIVAPLAVASLRLLIPTEIEFAVTPKSKNDQALCFDWKSTLPTIVVLLMKFVAIAKGIIEMMLFGIESDAYVFNMGWAIVNLIF
ncbi:MAG: glycosyltransferase, partial [Proteobacteria bacterium]|nr:glycosyltransferase [Pseudomonadota bacterium]